MKANQQGLKTRLVLGLAAAVPFVGRSVVGYGILPSLTLPTSLDETYRQVGLPFVIVSLIGGALGVLFSVLFVRLAVTRVGIDGKSRFDSAYSGWKAAKWAGLTYVAAYVFSWIGPTVLGLRVESLAPEGVDVYKGSAVQTAVTAPWTILAGIAVVIALMVVAANRLGAGRPSAESELGETRP